MKQEIENMSPTELRNNPHLYFQEDLTPEQLTALFHANPQLILKNSKVQLPKELILEFLADTISVRATVDVLSRPETASFHNEAVETFVLSYKSTFKKYTNGSCSECVIDSQFERAIEELQHAGITVSNDCVQKCI